MTPEEARATWRRLVEFYRPETKEHRLCLVRMLSDEHYAAILAERAASAPEVPANFPVDDPSTVCYIYVHED